MKLFKRIAQACEPYQRLLEELREGKSPVLMVGASEIHKAHFIYAAADELSGPALILTHDEQTARSFVENINAMAGDERAVLYPERDFNLREMDAVSREYEQMRLSVLSRCV